MSVRCVSVVVGTHQPIVRFGLIAMFRSEPDFNVVASCEDGAACVRTIRDLSPQLAVLDSSLPRQGGLQVLAAIRSEQLTTNVIFVSASPDSYSTADLIAKGARCVLSMEASMETLLERFRGALNGPGSKAARKSENGDGRAEGPSAMLTDRERQIMHLVGEGLSNKDIGRQCSLSDGTVKVHLHHVYEKLAIHNRTMLAMLAAGNLRPAAEIEVVTMPQSMSQPIKEARDDEGRTRRSNPRPNGKRRRPAKRTR